MEDSSPSLLPRRRFRMTVLLYSSFDIHHSVNHLFRRSFSPPNCWPRMPVCRQAGTNAGLARGMHECHAKTQHVPAGRNNQCRTLNVHFSSASLGHWLLCIRLPVGRQDIGHWRRAYAADVNRHSIFIIPSRIQSFKHSSIETGQWLKANSEWLSSTKNSLKKLPTSLFKNSENVTFAPADTTSSLRTPPGQECSKGKEVVAVRCQPFLCTIMWWKCGLI